MFSEKYEGLATHDLIKENKGGYNAFFILS